MKVIILVTRSSTIFGVITLHKLF